MDLVGVALFESTSYDSPKGAQCSWIIDNLIDTQQHFAFMLIYIYFSHDTTGMCALHDKEDGTNDACIRSAIAGLTVTIYRHKKL